MSSGKENINKLYDRYAQKLYFTSLRITANPEDAEEALNDAFIKYHYEKGHIENTAAWLTSVCVRKSIDALRKRKKEELFLADMPPDDEKEEDNDVEYSVERIRKALEKLPDGYRLILSLHLFEGYDYTEIAQITGLKESSIRSQYLRGKKKLLEQIKAEQI